MRFPLSSHRGRFGAVDPDPVRSHLVNLRTADHRQHHRGVRTQWQEGTHHVPTSVLRACGQASVVKRDSLVHAAQAVPTSVRRGRLTAAVVTDLELDGGRRVRSLRAGKHLPTV